MRKTYEQQLTENYNLDMADIISEKDEKIVKINKDLEKIKNEKGEIIKEISFFNEKYRNHISNKKNINKEDKREWKVEKKNIKFDISRLNKILRDLNTKITFLNNSINDIEHNANNALYELKRYFENEVNKSREEDNETLSNLIITALATKVKVELKVFETQIQSRNPRVGMSFGTNFKPRIFISGAATRKEKRVLTEHEKFEIRKKDDFSIRIIEIADMLNFNDPSLLEMKVLGQMKQMQGAQYISEFIEK